MAYLRKFMTAALLAAAFSVPSHAQRDKSMSVDDLPKFLISNIQNNERIEIDYVSFGCFHNSQEAIIFRSAYVTIPGIGEKALSWTEMASLDRYVEAVANIDSKAGMCTTQSTYTMTLFRNDEEVMTRTISDTQCISGKDMQTFGGLTYQLKKANQLEETNESRGDL